MYSPSERFFEGEGCFSSQPSPICPTPESMPGAAETCHSDICLSKGRTCIKTRDKQRRAQAITYVSFAGRHGFSISIKISDSVSFFNKGLFNPLGNRSIMT